MSQMIKLDEMGLLAERRDRRVALQAAVDWISNVKVPATEEYLFALADRFAAYIRDGEAPRPHEGRVRPASRMHTDHTDHGDMGPDYREQR